MKRQMKNLLLLLTTWTIILLLLKLPWQKNTLSRVLELSETSDALEELAPLKSAFPTVVKLLQLAMTISVTSAKCELTFSILKRVKTYLRSTMTEERLASLAVLSIERDITNALNLDEVVSEFVDESYLLNNCLSV